MRYFIYKDFIESLQKLFQKGGKYRKAAREVEAIYGRFRRAKDGENIDPFEGIPLTNSGESRIQHCIKYDLTGFSRLVTVKDNGLVVLCYCGKHEEVDNWLIKNKGLELRVDADNRLQTISASRDLSDPDKTISSENDWSDGLLYKKIPGRYYDKMSSGIARTILIEFEVLTTKITEEELSELCYRITDEDKMLLFYDVFARLKNSKIDEAKRRIDSFLNELFKIEEMSKEEIEKVLEGESFINFENFEADIIIHLMKTYDYQQWMLFMHPEQKKIVDKDFNGPAKLSGVSGSGKTCVLIKRAIRLAKKYEDEKILILTLNKSLSQLIEELKNVAAIDNIKNNIEVKSFWKLCQELLIEFESENKKLYDDLTWKTNESIDEIWEEYYHCELNNSDAEVLMPVHKSLLMRNIYPLDYLKQEFDWIRSSFPSGIREEYYEVERVGRYEPFLKSFRELILKGLEFWEYKMKDIGVIDYLGLANALAKYFEKLKPKYRSILVDEEQDFGTIEMKIIRNLVPANENDIFLCGDFAQKVYSKNHSYTLAGIELVPARIFSIKKNYRNSREILSAAYKVLQNNVNEEVLNAEDYKLLDPEFANYSNSKPLLLKTDNLTKELGHSLNFFTKNYDETKKCCIAICGYSLNEIKKIGKELNLPVLDGTIGLGSSKIFLSDLEQTKGFEFDYMCIINSNKDIVPNPNIPERESYRDLSRLYVAMTRAKIELFISYSDELSSFFDNAKEYFVEASWVEHEQEFVYGGH